ncbi:hypothetical protein ES319_D10G099700v1 [Gossypium barbadense]|uniref:Uncharacterized protein n=2 Tax=Gossypium TaxID=3633 RepID=A0A5J5PPW6_GOSBA|nr:hypothetical protein ES319_D10G099700v1 [Gossypium barbadense]TYG49596.1 hypothetical protein ES288_D10G106500v1 [Gossypium darwinii]
MSPPPLAFRLYSIFSFLLFCPLHHRYCHPFFLFFPSLTTTPLLPSHPFFSFSFTTVVPLVSSSFPFCATLLLSSLSISSLLLFLYSFSFIVAAITPSFSPFIFLFTKTPNTFLHHYCGRIIFVC